MIFDLFYNQFTLLAQPSSPTLSARYANVSVRDFPFFAPFPKAYRPNRASTQVSLELRAYGVNELNLLKVKADRK
jgi:hypothetical protein